MSDQVRREATSVTIGAGVALGVMVLGIGLLLGWIADELVGVPEAALGYLTLAIEVAAVLAVIGYVMRNRRR